MLSGRQGRRCRAVAVLGAVAALVFMVGCRSPRPELATREFQGQEQYWTERFITWYPEWTPPVRPYLPEPVTPSAESVAPGQTAAARPTRPAVPVAPPPPAGDPPAVESESSDGLPEAVFDLHRRRPPAATESFQLVPEGAGSSGGSPAAPTAAGGHYTIRKGDTLVRISRRVYGDENRWRDIYRANRDVLSNPSKLTPGLRIRLP